MKKLKIITISIVLMTVFILYVFGHNLKMKENSACLSKSLSELYGKPIEATFYDSNFEFSYPNVKIVQKGKFKIEGRMRNSCKEDEIMDIKNHLIQNLKLYRDYETLIELEFYEAENIKSIYIKNEKVQ